MKTLRTALITFGLTTLAYGVFAMLTVAIDPVYAGRSIYSLCSVSGFPAIVIGFTCLLAVLLISFAYAAFRPERKAKREEQEADDEAFLEQETVPAEEYKRPYAPVSERKQKRAAKESDLFADDDAEEPGLDETMLRGRQNGARQCVFCGTVIPEGETVCLRCGRRA